MALKKHGNTWHTHFFVDGERFRQVAPVPLAFPKNNEGTPRRWEDKSRDGQLEAGTHNTSGQMAPVPPTFQTPMRVPPVPRFLGPGIYPEFASTRVRAKSRVDFVSQPSDNRCGCEVSMTIRVELNPEMERQLAAEALARGIALEVVCAAAPPGSNRFQEQRPCARKPGRISRLFGCSCEQSAECPSTADRDFLTRNDLW